MSLGDKEISRSSPSPALEQPFRDRSNTLSEKPALPVIRDKYKDLTGEVEVSGVVSHRGQVKDRLSTEGPEKKGLQLSYVTRGAESRKATDVKYATKVREW